MNAEKKLRLDDAALLRQANLVGELLKERGQTVATAESCTGGWIGKVFTDISGSSDYFTGGLITYSNNLKHILLDVPLQTLAKHGAVSEAVVRQMALGAKAHTGADLTVAVSGVAGPGGGSANKPVGLVWFAVAGPGAQISALQRQFDGDREAVRRKTVRIALRELERSIQKYTQATESQD